MKHYLILLSVLWFSGIATSKCQTLAKRTAYKVVNIGEKMPDIPLGETSNNPSNNVFFSQFHGKLVILEFWATFCSSCLENFPHLQELQDQFREKIQIILVDPYESGAEIEKKMKKSDYYKYLHSDNIISLAKAELLNSMFPHYDLGYTVWIDQHQIVRLLGNTLNNHAEKNRTPAKRRADYLYKG